MTIRYEEEVKTKTTAELLDMFYATDEWNSDMLKVVERELIARNELPADVEETKEKLTQEEHEILLEGEAVPDIYLVKAWISLLWAKGLFIAHHYAYAKVEARYSHQTYYRYNHKIRQQGKAMFYVGIIYLIVFIFATSRLPYSS